MLSLATNIQIICLLFFNNINNNSNNKKHTFIKRPIQKLINSGAFCSLEYDDSVVYIDDEDDDDPSVPLYQTTPYACGKVLFASVLDSLVAAVSIIK